MRRKSSLVVYRMAIVALLSALGVVLMLYVKFPYPFAAWCEIEVSDLTVVIAYVLTGFPGAFCVGFIKTLLHLLIMPTSSTVGTALYIGDLAAFISSMLYLLGIFVTSHLLHLFKKGFPFRLLGYVVIALFVTIVMTLLNYLFITPSYLGLGYTTCFDSGAVVAVEEMLGEMLGVSYGYAAIIFVVYIPFNLLKCALILALYEILFNTLFFRILKDNKFFSDLMGRRKESLHDNLTEGLEEKGK